MMTPPKKILKESMSYSPEKQSGANTLIVSLPFLIFQCSSFLLILGACIKALLRCVPTRIFSRSPGY
jgi:hypothetical protein